MPEKFIKIFLASSEELVSDRATFGDFIGQLNNIYIKRGIYFELFKWEYSDASYKTKRKQDEYNEKIEESDLFLSLFYTKAGKYTIEELDTALKSYTKDQKPRVLVFLKKLKNNEMEDESLQALKKRLDEELTHFLSSYDSPEKLQLDFIFQIKFADLDLVTELKCEDSSIILNGEKIINLENIPYYNKNKDYVQLKADVEKLEAWFLSAKERTIKYPEDESFRSELLEISIEKNSKKKRLEGLEKDIFNLAERVAETSSRNFASERLKKAMEYLDKGEMAAANIVLEMNEIDKDAQSASERRKRDLMLRDTLEESIKVKERLLEECIQQYLLKADIILTDYSNENRFVEAEQCYKKATNLEKDNNLDRIATFRYANFLYKQNMLVEAERFYKESILFYKELAEKNPQTHQPYVAAGQNNLGALYAETQRQGEAEELYTASLAIWEELAEKNPQAHLPGVADVQNNLGALYGKTQRQGEAEAMYMASLAISEELAEKNPQAHLPDVADVQYNLGNLYKEKQRQGEAEAM